ncbi:MAG: ATP-binding cassette domain-containing protein [Rhodothermales bacterium]
MMSPLLHAQEVSKHFARPPGFRQRIRHRRPHSARVVRAVDRISFTLHAGEIYGLLGQSGSGKTTLARTLLRLIEPTSGRITFEGSDILAMSDSALKHHLRRKARMIFQHPDAALNPAFTVAKILDQALRTHTSLRPAERRDRAGALLQEVGLSLTYQGKYPNELSSGEKRRVSISRALATDPLLLIADEPVSGLDVSLQGRIVDLLLRLREERGLTLLLIAHDVGLIHRLCDRIGVMYQGTLVEAGTRDVISPGACRHPYTRALFDAQLSLLRAPSPWTTTLPVSSIDAPSSTAFVPAYSGCPYCPTCLRWQHLERPERCVRERPETSRLEENHQVACHFASDDERH